MIVTDTEIRCITSHSLYGWDCETVLILNPASIRLED
jgi:hypothetical protein